MERKNTILLTVIAIATLLVAVVGATFAYFTAQFTTTNDSNNKVEVKPSTVASVSFDYGNTVTLADTIYPGYQVVKEMHVTGDGEDDAKAASVKLTLGGDVGENIAANQHLKVTLYKGTSSGQVTFDTKPVTQTVGTETKYYDTGTLNTNSAQLVKTFETSSVKINDDYTIDGITGNTDSYYYLVVEYVNDNAANQDDEKNDTFKVTIAAEAVNVNVTP